MHAHATVATGQAGSSGAGTYAGQQMVPPPPPVPVNGS
jgi:hypothetical protein